MFRHARRAAAAAAFAVPFFFAVDAHSAELGSGTLSLTNPVITLPTRVYNTPNPTGNCSAAAACDFYNLTVNLPADHVSDKLKITASWPSHLVTDDFDLGLTNAQGADASGGQGGTTVNPEVIEVPALAGLNSYRVRIIPYYVRPRRGDTMSLRLEIVPGVPTVSSVVSLGGPTFENYVAPPDYRADEPTLDVNLNTDHAMMLFSTSVLKAVWNDGVSPPAIAWTDVTDPNTVPITADPIMSGDQFKLPNGKYASRMMIGQLQAANSLLYWTDDEGATWSESQGGGQPHGADNQSIAAGPYPAGVKPLGATYPHAIYYCSHSNVNAFCSRSDTGGLTWNPSRPIFQVDALCNNHGHVKVGVDGTVYVPMNNSCQGAEGVSISVDAGQSWTYVKVPNTVQGRWDSSIAIASDGKTIYYAYGETGTDTPMIIKGTLDKSIPKAPTIRWKTPAVNVGVPAGIKNMVFSTVVAGDPDRAAFAFHGTTTAGDSNDFEAMANAVWHLYVATTFDGGATWNLRDATPNDPTQKGAICHGTVCDTDTARPPDRNLLDFMDMVIDSKGRIVIGYADGCTADCAAPLGAPNYTHVGVIARQTSGKRMYAAFDPLLGGPPAVPTLDGVRHDASVNLEWTAPNDNGSPITGYVLQRQVNNGLFLQIATPTLTRYTDETAVNPSATYRYRLAAKSANGTSAFGPAFVPPRATLDACAAPGSTMLADPAGDILKFDPAPGLPVPQQLDVLKLSVSQPDDTAGGYRFTFTLRMANIDLGVVLPAMVWPVQFSTGDGATYEVSMSTMIALTPFFELQKNGVVVPGSVVTGSYTPAGEITMTVRASDLGLSHPGTDVLSSFLSRIAIAGSLTPDNMPNDLVPAGRFESLPSRACAVNAAPIASMFKSTDHGTAPLTVTFDASASYDPDAGDDVVRYVFEFGDGTPQLSTESPVTSHNYASPGVYGASVTVVDSRGKPSANADGGQITVQ